MESRVTATVAFVSCSGKKNSGRCSAATKYASPLFSKSKAFAESNADRWYILSALHGLVLPDDVLDDYDKTLNDMNRDERQMWAQRVASQIKACGAVRSGDQILWLAGRRYKEDLIALLKGVSHRDPLEGLGIGMRLRWLTNAISRQSLPPPLPPLALFG